MGSFWNELLSSCDTMSNVTIICSDGVIASHKIIVASASNFLKNIMISIPSGDDVTIFLPQFEKDKVVDFLTLNNAVKKEKDIFASSENDCQENYEDSYDSILPSSEENFLMKIDKVDPVETKHEIHEDQSYQFIETIPIKGTKATTGGNRIEHVKKMKKVFEDAITYYHSDESISARQAALKFDIHPNTLRTFIKTGKSFTGKGSKSKVFTEEEEQEIVKKAFDKVENGQKLSSKIIKELIDEEIEVLSRTNPERNFYLVSSSKISNFVRHFTDRHRLKRFFEQKVEKPCISPKQEVLSIKEIKDNVQLNFSFEDLERELIQNPTTKNEKRRNRLTQKKISFEKALAYYKSDESISVRAAALKFNVQPNTLRIMIKTGKPYVGKGSQQNKILSKEEENVIVSRAMEVVNSGQHFDSKVFRQLVKEEVDIININFPDRNLQLNNNFVQKLCYRYDLNKFYPDDKVRDFECDVCFKKFTFKKALVFHQKSIHYNFLENVHNDL